MQMKGRHSTIRSWRTADVAALVRHANNPDIARQLRDRFPHPYSRGNAHAFLRAATAAGEPSNLAIEVNGEAAGAIGYVAGTDVERHSAEVGYWLGEAYWNRGVVTEALVLLTEHLFATSSLLRLFALPFADNAGSIRVLEKAGYAREAILRSSSVKNGIPRDQALYARVNTAWRGVGT
jgi:ribosomal-protein-alanine N-acetyltransferase